MNENKKNNFAVTCFTTKLMDEKIAEINNLTSKNILSQNFQNDNIKSECFITSDNNCNNVLENHPNIIIENSVCYENLDLSEDKILEEMFEVKDKWSNGNTLKQKEFIEEYKKITNLKYLNNNFYNINGLLGVTQLKKSLYRILSEQSIKNLNSEIKNLVDLLLIDCSVNDYKVYENKIYLKNGIITLNKDSLKFEPKREFTIHLINSNYTTDKTEPKKWINFLSELFNEEDIDILQEYLGYCLLPTTDAQKALFIVGKGGEGKSVIGKVIKSIFDSSMINLKIQKLLTNNFSLAQLNGKLVVLEDELQDVALKEIDTFKSLISGGNFSIEEKYDFNIFFYHTNNILKSYFSKILIYLS